MPEEVYFNIDFINIYVKAIDVYCVYSGQPNSGYALFDNISLVSADSTDLIEYTYYTEGEAAGLLKQKESYFYTEYYEYEGRDLTRFADDSGNLTDYAYSDGVLVEIKDGSFRYNGGTMYPINGVSQGLTFTVTYDFCTEYVYDEFGLLTATISYALDEHGGVSVDSLFLETHYFYDTASGSRLFGLKLCEESDTASSVRYFYDQKDGKLLATVNEEQLNGVCYGYDVQGRLISVKPRCSLKSINSRAASSAFVHLRQPFCLPGKICLTFVPISVIM